MRWRGATTVLVLGLAGLATGCPADDGAPRGDSFEYRYLDASLPPEYHRSWTVTMDADGTGTYVVDSYGDVVSEGTVTLDDAAWEQLLDDAERLGLAGELGTECEGGTGRRLTVYAGDEVVQEVSVSDCDGGGRAAEQLDAWIAPVAAQVDLAEVE